MPVPFKAWLLLTSGPVLFLVAIVGTSVFLGLKGVDANQIAERVTLFMPHILLGVVLSLGVLVFFLLRVNAIWVLPHATKAMSDVAIGMMAGGFLAISYIFWIGPALAVLQREIGDYVPAGAVLSTISGNIGLFFIANVMLAPLMEETLYRGYAIPLLSAHFGVAWAVWGLPACCSAYCIGLAVSGICCSPAESLEVRLQVCSYGAMGYWRRLRRI